MTGTPASPCARARTWGTAVALVVVAVGSFALAFPGTLAWWGLSRDGLGYLATAYNWVEGRGLVEPVVYSYYVTDLSPPAPALAIRPPVISLLLALPVALGAGIHALTIVHVVFASGVGAAGVLLAKRSVPLAAATAFGIAVAWSPAYVQAAQQLQSEVVAVAVILAAIAASGRASASLRGALAFAVLTWLAWLTRPNLGLIAPALVLAATLELGPRAALRSRPLWVYLVAFVVLHRATVLASEAVFGFAPYAHYGVMTEILTPSEASRYQVEYVGWLAFVQENGGRVFEQVRTDVANYLYALLLTPTYLYVGWLALPAAVWALVRRDPRSQELRFAAFLGLGLAATLVGTYAGADPGRYPLLAAVCFWLIAVRALCDLAAWARSGRLAAWAPLALVLVLFATRAGPDSWNRVSYAWGFYREFGTNHTLQRWSYEPGFRQWVPATQVFCPHIDPDAIVASPDPWTFYLWCGNAGLWLPRDLETLDWLHRYLDEQAPAYLIVDGSPEFAAFSRSGRLEKIRARGPQVLYRVRDAPARSRPWIAPPPIAFRGPLQGSEARFGR